MPSHGKPASSVPTTTTASVAVYALGGTTIPQYRITPSGSLQLLSPPMAPFTGTDIMGDELSLPVTVAENTAPPSAGFTGGGNDGLYRAGRTYNPLTGRSTTGGYYDALSGQITLPSTSPDSVSLVLDYSTGDAYDVYSGGFCRDKTLGATEIDIGLTVGHTGNFGYSPTSNYSKPPKAPDNNSTDQIQPGQTLTVTYEAPGCPDIIDGSVVPARGAYLVVQGASPGTNINVSPAIPTGNMPPTVVSVPYRRYVFSQLPVSWTQEGQKSIKYITSIAQDHYTTSYNGPPGLPNPIPRAECHGAIFLYVGQSSSLHHLEQLKSPCTTGATCVSRANPLHVTCDRDQS